jgi:hypothetical protein
VNLDLPRKPKQLVRRRRKNNVDRFSANYLQLLAERYGNGLLDRFNCSRCNRLSLDPIGWNSRDQPLCEVCADREKAPEDSEPRPHIKGLRLGDAAELRQFAEKRGICVEAIELAQRMGTAKIGVVCGYPSIVLLDQSGRCMEGRRLDNLEYPASGGLDERKAHTIKGSQKNWPVGILPHEQYLRRSRVIALVEGSTDYFAALHFAVELGKEGVVPVSVLSRGIKELHPKSTTLLRGRRVRIFPHEDGDGLGIRAALNWAKHLERLGCQIDFFVFRGLRKANGEPVKDLNDCAAICAKHAPRLKELFP